jgi:hypothetical protein
MPSPGEYERRMAENPDFRRTVFTAVGLRLADFEHLAGSVPQPGSRRGWPKGCWHAPVPQVRFNRRITGSSQRSVRHGKSSAASYPGPNGPAS